MIVLRPPESPGIHLSVSEIVDLLWLNAALSDGVKHIHARAGADCVEVGVFTVASEQSISDYIVRKVCGRAIHSVPALRGWSIHRP
ncbi:MULTISPECIES: hypothetical protein [Catellatospora]|nr:MULTISPECIES: hypothetical protein [Catellatospora]RKE06815.1 hypothetical protein C8E86_1637 [Catellatospora citrea]GIF94961.1 hypothetical protein Cci01nite_00550 [Catellatospora citrea]